jgi:4-hydroxy-tetrahydrodipicolinate reductase
VHSMRMAGLLADQRVVLGGEGETLTIQHTTIAPTAYEKGILLALRRAATAEGVTVGLDTLLGLHLPGSR